MESLHLVREMIMAFVKRYDNIISFVLRFLAGWIIYSAIMGIGHYNTAFEAIANMGFLFNSFMGLLFAILPLNASYVIMILLTAVQFSAQLEIALIVLLGLVTMFLFYGQFGKRESVLVISMLMGFYFNIPYIVPIIAGLYFGITSIIPMSISALIVSYSKLIFSIVDYSNEAIGLSLDMITDMEIEDIFGAFMELYESFSLNSEPVQGWLFLTVAIFVVFIFVYIVSRLPINYGKEIAIGLATIINIFAFIFANAFVNFGSVPMIFFMSILASLIMIVYNFMKSALAYSKAGRVEFSDEDFYYYVKYIPKIKTNGQTARFTETPRNTPSIGEDLGPKVKKGKNISGQFDDDDDTHTYRPRTREDYRKEAAATEETKTKRVSPRTMDRVPRKR